MSLQVFRIIVLIVWHAMSLRTQTSGHWLNSELFELRMDWPDTTSIADQLIRLKCVVRFSQAVNSRHNVSVTIQRDYGKILECVCDCVAGRGKCCSHTAGLLYKIKDATARGFTGLACTDTACSSQHNWTANVLKKTKEMGEHFASATTAYGDQRATSVAKHGKSGDSSNSNVGAALLPVSPD